MTRLRTLTDVTHVIIEWNFETQAFSCCVAYVCLFKKRVKFT